MLCELINSMFYFVFQVPTLYLHVLVSHYGSSELPKVTPLPRVITDELISSVLPKLTFMSVSTTVLSTNVNYITRLSMYNVSHAYRYLCVNMSKRCPIAAFSGVHGLL